MKQTIPRTNNGFYEVYDPVEDIYHEYGDKQAAQKALSAIKKKQKTLKPKPNDNEKTD